MTPFWMIQGETVVATPNFWVYWAITAPVTMVVMLCWRVWLKKDQRLRQTENGDIEMALANREKGC